MARRASVVAIGSTAGNDVNSRSARQHDGTDAPTDLRTALRQATVELHRHLDGAPEQRALLARDLTQAQYAAIMWKQHRALAVCEATLAALDLARPHDVRPYRPRLPALEADLARLDAPQHSTSQPHIPDLPMTEPAPALNPAEACGRYLGTRYVLEGSTQGAGMIAKRLERHLPTLSVRAFDYWRVQAEEAAGWKVFAGSLASLPARGPMASAAIAAARTTFVVFLRVFGIDAPEPSDARTPAVVRDGDHQ